MTRKVLSKLALFFPQSLIAEYRRDFGEDSTEKLINIFGGTTLNVPSHKEIETATRDIIIYETLERSRDSAESRRLGAVLGKQHELSRHKIRAIYNSMRKRIRQNERQAAREKKVSQHQRTRKNNPIRKHKKWGM